MTEQPERIKKKLIEVALPLEAINRESAREKSIRHGHPSTLHLWWARRPLAACRAVLFGSLVDDPSSRPEEFPTEEEQERERKRLFGIIEELVKWENSNNEEVLERARKEILKSTDGNPPPVLDPFCGGGSIPLEAQRLGLEAHASDLNPVAVLITKALIELPSKFANRPPINCDARQKLVALRRWERAGGLADDIRYYGRRIARDVQDRIQHLYPAVTRDDGTQTQVIAWLWARTAICPNPACAIRMPLVRSFALSTSPGRDYYVDADIGEVGVRFFVRKGRPSRSGTMTRKGAICLRCETNVAFADLRQQSLGGKLGRQLLAIVIKEGRGRSYVSPTEDQAATADAVPAFDYPQTLMPEQALGFRVQAYGLNHHRDLFTARQLAALNTLVDCTRAMHDEIMKDALSSGLSEHDASEYTAALRLSLALTASKAARFHTALSYWRADEGKLSRAFGRQTVSLAWDYAEANPFAGSGGDFVDLSDGTAAAVGKVPAKPIASVTQRDAAEPRTGRYMLNTDPPYFANVGYAALSDIFYIWLRRAAADLLPSLFSTLLVPKQQEIVADPARFGGIAGAETHFLNAIRNVFETLRGVCDTSVPTCIYYAYKQEEEDNDEELGGGRSSTGWETFLEAVISGGFQIGATLPLRTEGPTRMRGQNSNALASSIVIVARPRAVNAPIATRRDFIAALHAELPFALTRLRGNSIAAVDLAQAAIGPGMAVFSRYAKVIETDGTRMTVRIALNLINKAIDDSESEQESEYDSDTRWAVAWFTDHGMAEGLFGEAETLSKAKNTSIDGMQRAGIITASKGKVRLIERNVLPSDWDPARDGRLPVWEVTQHLIRRLQLGGDQDAADLLRKVGGMGEIARDLAYRLYSICDRKGWASEAIAYNSLVVAWPEISRLASELAASAPSQMALT